MPEGHRGRVDKRGLEGHGKERGSQRGVEGGRGPIVMMAGRKLRCSALIDAQKKKK